MSLINRILGNAKSECMISFMYEPFADSIGSLNWSSISMNFSGQRMETMY